jgi:anti-sigma28 factor (negative regulator of flagellin synthesis)
MHQRKLKKEKELMYGVSHITGVIEPAATRRTETRDPRMEMPSAPGRDSVTVSDDARQAAAAARMVQWSSEAADAIRAEKVAEAKRKIEEGTYRVHEAVLRVAVRVSPAVS